jgi:5'(3')-deoxyribonucleotidase
MKEIDKPVIGIDLDGVLADTNLGWQEYFGRQQCGRVHPNRPILPGWDKWKLLCDICWNKVLYDYDIITNHEEIHGAWEAMRDLSEHFRLICLTSRNPNNGPATAAWLKQNILYDFFETVIHFEDKNIILEAYNAVAHVDDSPDKLKALANSSVEAIIFDQPYNKNVLGHRVYNWSEATKFLIQNFGKKQSINKEIKETVNV